MGRQRELPIYRCVDCGRTYRRFWWFWRHVCAHHPDTWAARVFESYPSHFQPGGLHARRSR